MPRFAPSVAEFLGCSTPRELFAREGGRHGIRRWAADMLRDETPYAIATFAVDETADDGVMVSLTQCFFGFTPEEIADRIMSLSGCRLEVSDDHVYCRVPLPSPATDAGGEAWHTYDMEIERLIAEIAAELHDDLCTTE